MSEPLSPTFSLSLQPTPDDIDELDHVSNLVYLRWVQDAAIAHSEAAGYHFEDYKRMRAAFVVRRHEIDYLRPALLGDDIVVRTWLDSWKAATSVRMTSIVKRIGAGEREVKLASGKTLWALIGLDSGRPQRISEEMKAMFARPLQGSVTPATD